MEYVVIEGGVVQDSSSGAFFVDLDDLRDSLTEREYVEDQLANLRDAGAPERWIEEVESILRARDND